MSAQDVAKWMLGQVTEHGRLYQSKAAYAIRDQFGDGYTYQNRNGNLAIGKQVLTAFTQLSKETVVWLRGERAWWLRNESHKPGRQQP